jgi:hypothetical protein
LFFHRTNRHWSGHVRTTAQAHAARSSRPQSVWYMSTSNTTVFCWYVKYLLT